MNEVELPEKGFFNHEGGRTACIFLQYGYCVIANLGIYVQVQSSIDRTAVPFSPQQSTTKVALVKATKHKANPATMRFVWRTETMVLPDHKVAITKQFKDC